MHFEKLSRFLLLQLEQKGYNILRSVNAVDDENLTWIPGRTKDIFLYSTEIDPETALLVISDAIRHIDPEQLVGEVLIEDD